MSVREDIASNIRTAIANISSPITIKKITRQPFNLDELAQSQYPAVIVQSSLETREDIELGDGAKTRLGSIDFVILGYVQGAESNIDTLRNQLITAIETALETDITRGGVAKDTQVTEVETDEGTLFPIGGIRMTVNCVYDYQSGTP